MLLRLTLNEDDSDNPDILCADLQFIYCCGVREESLRYPGFHLMSGCTTAKQQKLITKAQRISHRAWYRRRVAEKLANQAIQPSRALIKNPITSDEIECPAVSQGLVMARIHKLCCQRPWTTVAGKAKRLCKKC